MTLDEIMKAISDGVAQVRHHVTRLDPRGRNAGPLPPPADTLPFMPTPGLCGPVVLSPPKCAQDHRAVTAPGLLTAAAAHMKERAKTYDQPGGERSIGRTVEAFNAITGKTLSESEGWLFMELLKAVRDFSTPGGHADSQEDRIAYAALGAEARRAGR